MSLRHSEDDRKQDQPEILGPEGAPAGAAGQNAAPKDAEAAASGGATSGAGQEIQKLQAEKQDLMNTLVRRQADFENYRKRVEKERHADRHRGVENLVEHLLPMLDAFDRALTGHGHDDSTSAEYRKGFELIRRQLWDALSKQGLKRIEAVGKEFDPHLHHAIERVETDEHADGTVVGELQPGYTFHDRVLRPAMVRVAAQPVSKHSRGN